MDLTAPRGLRGIIFDKDGTLFDLQATWAPVTGAVIADLAGGDAAVAERLAAALGYDLVKRRLLPGSPVIAGTPAEMALAAASALSPPADPRALLPRIEALAAGAKLVEPAPLLPLLEGLLARGLRLAVVTNDGEAAARAEFARAGVETRFHAIIGYDSGHGAKPAPGPLAAAAGLLGLVPRETLVVGDTPHDFLAAEAAGMRAVAVASEFVEAAAARVEAVLPHVGHLPRWLDG